MTNKKIDGIYRATDLTEQLWDLYKGKSHKQYHVGFPCLEHYFKIIKPSFILITGVPNCGKSSLTYDIIMNLAELHKFKFLIFSPEHSLATNLKRLIEKRCKKPFDIIFKDRASETEVLRAFEFINEHFFFVDRKGHAPDVDWILDRAQYCADTFNIDGLIIDPYNEIDPARTNIREDEHISLLISKIKRFNRENEIFSFMIAHPTKQIRNPDGKFTVNSLYDVSGSAHWNNKSDVGIIVERDFEAEVTNVRIAKVREIDVQGRIGEVTLKWNDKTRCFHDIMGRNLDD
ncbi:MAG: putative ATP-dependent helicase [Prokaryotic dsDNA virus sp.]|nr:MAG: putative ATP-dependent helicase [Prokaryotic dsDNA virus sp.]|tara:strand:+ start:172 stop:1038 length:867 start_codon:yes stop_codon:yes gene_type:complete